MKTCQFNEFILYQVFIDFFMAINYNFSIIYELGVLTSKWEKPIKNNERERKKRSEFNILEW